MVAKNERETLLQSEHPRASRSETFGLFLMGLAAIFFGTQGLLIRYVTAYGGLSVSTVVLVRGIIQTTLTLTATAIVQDGASVFKNSPRLWALLAFRGGTGAVALLALFSSFNSLDLSIACSIYYTSK